MPQTDATSIHIKGAREHNLREVEVRLPRGRITVVTGVSGSGKSSLAFDTLYAEGYRKYMESLSTQARQLLEQIRRPDVDYIHGLSPVLAIEQRTGGASPRSTIATVTEIADYARLLWAHGGEQRCPLDGAPISRRTTDQCLDHLFARWPAGTRLQLLAPVLRARVSVLRDELPRLRQRGYQRVRIEGELRTLDDPKILSGAAGNRELEVDLVVDRVVLGPDQRSRVADSLELAFREGQGRVRALAQIPGESAWAEEGLSRDLACTRCGAVYEALTARHFSANHPQGACPGCGGLGRQMRFEEELVVPKPELSVREGAIKPLRLGGKALVIRHGALLRQLAEQMPFELDRPWRDLPADLRRAVLEGAPERLFSFRKSGRGPASEPSPWPGVFRVLEQAKRETSSDGYAARLTTYQSSCTCAVCHGDKVSPRASHVFIGGQSLPAFFSRSITDALGWIRALAREHPEVAAQPGAPELLQGVERRLGFLEEVGLGYLGLDREYATLSGGEAQRVRLATQLGMGLVGVVYVLDEPTVGLHPHDNQRLLSVLRELRDRGNTLVVVEHDEDTMRIADHLVELGPGAGREGGHLVFEGTPAACAEAPASVSRTGPYLAGRMAVERNAERRAPDGRWLTVRGAAENNLRGIDVSFPLGLLTCVTGVSGSGKSSLVNDILARAAARRLHGARELPGRHRAIEGLDPLTKVVRVDQEPIGRSPRSNPATFTKIFDVLRDLFARCPLAKVRGYKASRFSFNTRGGRCERCQGDGVIRLDMQFLADAYAECPACGGQRYNRETLEVRFAGRSIAEVLELTVSEAAQVFRHIPKVMERLEVLEAVGLGYVQLGQGAPTLSGGEAQRLKLSLELSRRQQGQTLYLLDEPTTGLHWADIQRLTDLLFRLRDAGNTIIVIEHALEVIGLADWVVDLGPGGGAAGGRLQFAGTPEDLAGRQDSLTGQALARRRARKF